MEILELSPYLIKEVEFLLFDLDGTLVEMDSKFQLPLTLRAIWRFRKLMPPWKFIKVFWQAVEKIQANESLDENYKIFREHLLKNCSGSKADLDKTLEDIILIDFPKSGKYFTQTPGASESLELARNLNYRMILATNPMFPLRAVKTRLEYGGVDESYFEFITHSQNSTRCKPKVSYYQELISKLKLDPKKCLMIGNDPVKDLPAMELGIKTFLLKGEKFDKNFSKYHPHPFFYGSHQDLQKLLKGAKEC